mgnify:CR=1 FL=1
MSKKPLVSIIMGSQSDWRTMKNASKTLKSFKITHEVKIISAHRTPKRMFEFAERAQKKKEKEERERLAQTNEANQENVESTPVSIEE